jgi:hypothetical protein
MKIRSVGAKFLLADGRPGREAGRRDESNSRLPQLCELAYVHMLEILWDAVE